MEFDKSNMIIDHDLNRLATEEVDDMVVHILCYQGKMDFLFDGRPFTLTAQCGMIVRMQRLVENIRSLTTSTSVPLSLTMTKSRCLNRMLLSSAASFICSTMVTMWSTER